MDGVAVRLALDVGGNFFFRSARAFTRRRMRDCIRFDGKRVRTIWLPEDVMRERNGAQVHIY